MPAKQETQVLSLGQKYSLEKEMETHSNILAWEIPWTEEPGRLQSIGSQRGGHDCDLACMQHHSLCQFLRMSLFLMTLTDLKLFCKMFLNWDLTNVFFS